MAHIGLDQKVNVQEQVTNLSIYKSTTTISLSPSCPTADISTGLHAASDWLVEHSVSHSATGLPTGPKEKIGVIKILLMGQSEPLCKMLEESDMAEKGEINLPDIEPKHFKDFLKCVYGGSDMVIKHLSFEECAKLLYIAQKYLVADIKQDVLGEMVKVVPLSIDNLFVALKNIVCFQDETLKNIITDKIKSDTNKILADKRFLDISYEALLIIVEQESLNVKELDVFLAVVKWAEHKAQTKDGAVLREHISGHLQCIRFRVMTAQEFCKDVIPTGVLTAEDVCKMCISIASNEPHNLTLFSNNKHSRFNQETSHQEMRLEYSCSVENITENEYVNSDYTELDEYSCQFRLGKADDYLELYLKCKPLHSFNDDLLWECDVTVKLILVNQCGKPDFELLFSRKYQGRDNTWGFPEFKEWADVVNLSEGFIKHGNIVVAAYITFS